MPPSADSPSYGALLPWSHAQPARQAALGLGGPRRADRPLQFPSPPPPRHMEEHPLDQEVGGSGAGPSRLGAGGFVLGLRALGTGCEVRRPPPHPPPPTPPA